MAPAPVSVSTLRDAALNEDWAAWAQAWHALDANECAALLAALDHKPKAEGETSQPSGITLTLCGERNAQTFNAQPQTYLKRFMNIFGTQRPSTLLEQL
jgi:hypothetical protein